MTVANLLAGGDHSERPETVRDFSRSRPAAPHLHFRAGEKRGYLKVARARKYNTAQKNTKPSSAAATISNRVENGVRSLLQPGHRTAEVESFSPQKLHVRSSKYWFINKLARQVYGASPGAPSTPGQFQHHGIKQSSCHTRGHLRRCPAGLRPVVITGGTARRDQGITR